MLRTASYAGIRVHSKDKTNRTRWISTPGVQQFEGKWESIVPLDLFLRVQNKLDDPSRKTIRPGRDKHLASNRVRCDGCDDLLVAHLNHGEPVYYCQQRGCVTISEPALDALILVDVALYLMESGLGAEEARQELESRPTAELLGINSEIARLEGELLKLPGQVATGRMTSELAGATEAEINTELARLRRQRQELVTPADLRHILSPGPDDDPDLDIAERWLKRPLSAKKEVLRMVLAPEHMGTLYVLKAPPGRRGRGTASLPIGKRVEYRDAVGKVRDWARSGSELYQRQEDAPEGHRKCTGPCGQVKPATTEHFYDDRPKNARPGIPAPHQLNSWCKACCRAKQRQYNADQKQAAAS
jgi:hypothetical protein